MFSLDPPRDNGGADIQQYHLELEESKGKKIFRKKNLFLLIGNFIILLAGDGR